MSLFQAVAVGIVCILELVQPGRQRGVVILRTQEPGVSIIVFDVTAVLTRDFGDNLQPAAAAVGIVLVREGVDDAAVRFALVGD